VFIRDECDLYVMNVFIRDNVIYMCNEVENQKKKPKFLTLPRVPLGKGYLYRVQWSALPRAMTVALGKGQALPRAWPDWPSANIFFKKKENSLPRACPDWLSTKIFFKKKENSLPRASQMGSWQRKRAR
jgi:hypothetical protein